MRYKKVLCVLFIGFCVVGMIYAGNGLLNTRNTYHDAKEGYRVLQEQKKHYETRQEHKEDDLTEAMREINPDYIAWIAIEGTNINYPIVQASQGYLKQDFYGKESISGTLFINSEQEPFKDLNTIIFGHNMKDGSMFSDLKKYLNKAWYEKHPYIKIQHEGQSTIYEVISVQILSEKDTRVYEYLFDSEEYKAFLRESLLQSSINTEKVINDSPVITLSTCYGTSKRLIITAQEVC